LRSRFLLLDIRYSLEVSARFARKKGLGFRFQAEPEIETPFLPLERAKRADTSNEERISNNEQRVTNNR
jgi:hypothetical protein